MPSFDGAENLNNELSLDTSFVSHTREEGLREKITRKKISHKLENNDS